MRALGILVLMVVAFADTPVRGKKSRAFTLPTPPVVTGGSTTGVVPSAKVPADTRRGSPGTQHYGIAVRPKGPTPRGNEAERHAAAIRRRRSAGVATRYVSNYLSGRNRVSAQRRIDSSMGRFPSLTTTWRASASAEAAPSSHSSTPPRFGGADLRTARQELDDTADRRPTRSAEAPDPATRVMALTPTFPFRN